LNAGPVEALAEDGMAEDLRRFAGGVSSAYGAAAPLRWAASNGAHSVRIVLPA